MYNLSNMEVIGSAASGEKSENGVFGVLLLGIYKCKEVGESMKKLAMDDPRRIIHSFKVGLALAFVSLFYFYQPLFRHFGATAIIWSIITVVVVFEFSVGATLSKGLNRGMTTLLGGAFGVGAHYLSTFCGHTAQPILLALFLFLLASASTFVRFFPRIKARYDYGMLIFILTFSMVSISSFRDDQIIELAYKRLLTIMIGGAICVIISVSLCPVWAGLDLHFLISLNLDKLANFLQGFGEVYFKTTEDNGVYKDDKSVNLQGYKSVLNSKPTEESLANFARWEPAHGQFKFCHPWKLYLKVGILTRQCAYNVETLDSYLNAHIQAPLEVRSKIQETCIKMSLESGKALKELSLAIKNMSQPSAAKSHIEIAKNAAKSLLKSGLWDDSDLLTVIPAATVASLLVDIVTCVDKIAESVYELASLAEFKTKTEFKLTKISQLEEVEQSCKTIVEGSSDQIIITMNGPVRVEMYGNGTLGQILHSS